MDTINATGRGSCGAAPAEAGGVDMALFKALCEPARIDLIRQLATKGRSDVGTLAAGMAQDRSVVSRHLQLLERAGVVRARKVGRQVFYELDGPAIADRLEAMARAIRTMAAGCCPGA